MFGYRNTLEGRTKITEATTPTWVGEDVRLIFALLQTLHCPPTHSILYIRSPLLSSEMKTTNGGGIAIHRQILD